MPPKKRGGSQAASTSRGATRASSRTPRNTNQPRTQPTPISPPPPPPIPNPTLELYGITFTDPRHTAAYTSLFTRHLIPTRFFDRPTVQALGIEEDVDRLFGNLGWGGFLGTHAVTYRRLTLEFLSTLAIQPNPTEDPATRSIAFQLRNRRYELTYPQLNAIFGWPDGGTHVPPSHEHRRYCASTFWNLITDYPPFNPQSAKASMIVNPAFRYAHRLLVNALFFKGDFGGVYQEELFFLWASTRSAPTIPIDHAAWLVYRFLKVRQTSSRISCGGMITRIAAHFRVSFQGLEVVAGDTRLDIPHLRAAGMITPVEGDATHFWWRLRGADVLQLPAPLRTTLTNPRNYLLLGEEDEEDEDYEAPEDDDADSSGSDDDDDDGSSDGGNGDEAVSTPSAPSSFPPFYFEQQAYYNQMVERLYNDRAKQGAFDDLPPLPPRPGGDL